MTPFSPPGNASESRCVSGPPPLSLRRNFIWTFFGNIIYAGSQFSLLVILAKLGGARSLGQFDIAMAVSVPIVVLSGVRPDHRPTPRAKDPDPRRSVSSDAGRCRTTPRAIPLFVVTLFMFGALGVARLSYSFSPVDLPGPLAWFVRGSWH